MIRVIEQAYVLEAKDLKQAVWEWLKGKDVPVPEKPDLFILRDFPVSSVELFWVSSEKVKTE